MSQPFKPRGRRDAGFSILEILIGASMLAVALLGHTATIFNEHKMSESHRARSTALLAAEQFIERLRATEDWIGLYAKLNTLREVSTNAGAGGFFPDREWMDLDTLLVAEKYAKGDHVKLEDGRYAFPAQTYDESFGNPTGLHSLHVLVDVPAAPENGSITGQPVLREDLALDAFGLPADLNGDGVIDDASHDDDYHIIPIVVNMRWTHSTGRSEEIKIASWLWGYR